MGEANEARSKAMENLSPRIDKYPRDLLQRFVCSSTQESEHATPSEVSEEIELNLGLSLGGRFGVDRSAKKLIRSSSVAGTIPVVRDDESLTQRPMSYTTLTRTSSLPTETEAAWRKRKELQTLRRMVAKRRRCEKQRSSKAEKEEERKEIQGPAGLNLRDKQQFAVADRFVSMVVPPLGMPTLAAAERQAVLGGVVEAVAKGKSSFLGLQGFGRPSSQGSAESQGGSSTVMSESESKPLQGSGCYGEARSPASDHSLQERINQEASVSSGTKNSENPCRTSRAEMENLSKKPDHAENRGKEIGMNAMEDMPCVFTKGDGPSGRRIEGILYRYGKGEQVRIMCVCHGSFHSPAEFVKHAGGGDVAHPLKHIVVNPSSTSFL
ncbi:ninja-family protein AFP3 [Alnus glutinosa]|uniref:ninja-family protein AFP3 n=1 Tax=Alnus glutinosa TaxID=3517 RepID=UPI002D76692A|nr:ninja-family protein AFP3 [Alnus glutinosa]XP_062162621.1 ninja-family protein AFP3 [Alnus glutinosa]XP_062162629.1 ninja-family protein AFP3 [Alnus glutinosa]